MAADESLYSYFGRPVDLFLKSVPCCALSPKRRKVEKIITDNIKRVDHAAVYNHPYLGDV